MCGGIAAIALFCEETFTRATFVRTRNWNVAIHKTGDYYLIAVDRTKKKKKEDLMNEFKKILGEVDTENIEIELISLLRSITI